MRRILAVIGLSGGGGRVRLDPDGTLLIGYGAWASLEGYPPSDNATSQVCPGYPHQTPWMDRVLI